MARRCFEPSHKTMKDFRAIVDRKVFIFLAFLAGSVLSVTGRDVTATPTRHNECNLQFHRSKNQENATEK